MALVSMEPLTFLTVTQLYFLECFLCHVSLNFFFLSIFFHGPSPQPLIFVPFQELGVWEDCFWYLPPRQEEQRVRHLITFYLIPSVTLKAKAATELSKTLLAFTQRKSSKLNSSFQPDLVGV